MQQAPQILRRLGAHPSLLIASTLAWPAGNGIIKSGSRNTVTKPTKAKWQPLLDADSYAVLFKESTEAPGSSPLNGEKRAGTFICAACYQPLFSSDAKFESGTGWPSFTQPIEGSMETKRDFRMLLPRTEYHCARCGGHQGHVFNDGPKPRGERWCNNGLALQFVPQDAPLPDLR